MEAKEFKIREKLQGFVTNVVVIYENTLNIYVHLIEDNIQMPEIEKIAKEKFSGDTKTLNAAAGDVLIKVICESGFTFKRTDVKKIVDLLYFFKKEPTTVRTILVEAAYRIFRSFECQFVQVIADSSWEIAMVKLAEDAVGRTMNYYKANPDVKFSTDSVTLGVIFGKSNKMKSFLQYKNLDWNTDELFSKVGLTDETRYYSKKDQSNNVELFGYRLVLQHDNLDEYREVKPPKTIYKYLLSDEDITKEVHQLLCYISKHDRNLEKMEETLQEVISEKNEVIEEEFEVLKSLIAQVDLKIHTSAVIDVFEKKYQAHKSEKDDCDICEQVQQTLLNDISKQNETREKNEDLAENIKNLDLRISKKFDKFQESVRNNQDDIRAHFQSLLKKIDKIEQQTFAKLDKIEQQHQQTNANFDNMKQQTSAKFDDFEQQTNDKLDNIKEQNQKTNVKLDSIEKQNRQTDEAIDELTKLMFQFERKKRIKMQVQDNNKEEQSQKRVTNLDDMKKKDTKTSLVDMDEQKVKLGSIQKRNQETTVKLADLEEQMKKIVPASDVKRCIWFCIPSRLLFFTGRKQQLQDIDKNLKQNNIVVICGLGGVGKSELAFEYVHTYYDTTKSVICINASSDKTTLRGFKNVHNKLGLNIKDEDGEMKCSRLIAEEVYQGIGEKGFFIFDDAENYKSIKQFLPLTVRRKPRIIITTSNVSKNEWCNRRVTIQMLHLESLTDIEAKEFVRVSLKIQGSVEDDDVEKLAKKLHNFPLALNQAVAYINSRSLCCKENDIKHNLSDFLFKYAERPDIFLNYEIDDGEKTIWRTLEITLFKIKGDSDYGEQAIHMLNIISYFMPNDIPEDILTDEVARGKESDMLKITTLLEKYSILKLNDGKVSVHALIQEVVRLILKKQNEELKYLKIVLNLLKQQRNDISIFSSHIASAWKHSCKYSNLIKDFIIDDSTTYFHIIVERSSFKTVKTIITNIKKTWPDKLDSVINGENKERATPLHKAASSGNKQVVKLLIQHGAKVNAKKLHQWTPLHMAVKEGFLNVVNILLENGASINCKTRYQYTPLHFASRFGWSDIVKCLLSKGADVEARASHGETVLHFATKSNRIECVKVLFENDQINVNAETQYKLTPLHFATKQGNLEMVRMLLRKRAEVNAKNLDNFTSLHFASFYNYLNIVNELLAIDGIEINPQTSHGNTPFHLACAQGNFAIGRALINKKANIDILNNDGKTGLILAEEFLLNAFSAYKESKLSS